MTVYRDGPSRPVPPRLPIAIRRASRCEASWDDHMLGGGRVRECGVCSRTVYNLTGLSPEVAEGLCRGADGRPPERLYLREDQTLLASDCPVGMARRQRRRLAWLARWTGTALVLSAVASLPQGRDAQPPHTTRSATTAPFKFDALPAPGIDEPSYDPRRLPRRPRDPWMGVGDCARRAVGVDGECR